MDATKKYTLYSYWQSSCSWRVRAVLALKGIEYNYRSVSITSGQQFNSEFQSLNPLGFVPVLIVPTSSGTETLFESLAIIDYLEDIIPEPAIYPKDPITKAKVKGVAEFIVSSVQPLQNICVIPQIAQQTLGDSDKAFEWAAKWIVEKFVQLEKLLKDISGKYTVGDEFSLADICLVPQVYNASVRYKVDLNQFPTIKRLYDFLWSDSKVIFDTRPEVMPDAPSP